LIAFNGPALFDYASFKLKFSKSIKSKTMGKKLQIERNECTHGEGKAKRASHNPDPTLLSDLQDHYDLQFATISGYHFH
jgi:hypothetical protein